MHLRCPCDTIRRMTDTAELLIDLPFEHDGSVVLPADRRWWTPITEAASAKTPDPVLVDDNGDTVLPIGSIVLFGRPKVGKSLITAYIATRWLKESEDRHVMIITASGESDPADWVSKFEAWGGAGVIDRVHAHIWDRHESAESNTLIAQSISTVSGAMLVLDSGTSLCDSVSDQTEVAAWHGMMHPIKEAAETVVTVAHEPKSSAEGGRGTALGSTMWESSADVLCHVKGTAPTDDYEGEWQCAVRSRYPRMGGFRITTGKINELEVIEDVKVTPLTKASGDPWVALRKDILSFIRSEGPSAVTKIRDSVEGKAAVIGNAVKAMVEEGSLDSERRGNATVYKLPEAF